MRSVSGCREHPEHRIMNLEVNIPTDCCNNPIRIDSRQIANVYRRFQHPINAMWDVTSSNGSKIVIKHSTGFVRDDDDDN